MATIKTMVNTAWTRISETWGSEPMSVRSVADELGVSYQAARKVKLGGGIALENATTYAKKRGLNPVWLVTGEGPKRAPSPLPLALLKITDLKPQEAELVMLFRDMSADHQHELLVMANQFHNVAHPMPSAANPFAAAPPPGGSPPTLGSGKPKKAA